MESAALAIPGGGIATGMAEEERAVSGEERVRAGTYSLLATLLAAPPTREVLAVLAGIEAVEDDARDGLGAAWHVLRLAGERAEVGALDDEYHDLFVGLGRGELVPYGSWYMTGFLMDKPLAVLRADLGALGFERQEGVKEPEDHVAALLEVMAMLVGSGEYAIHDQRRFFDSHLAPWMPTFFKDLQSASSARFYRAVGRFGDQFIEFEKKYLGMLV